MLLPKALKMRAIKQTMALITDSIGRTKCAPAQMPWHLRHRNPALLNRQGMSTHSKMENGSELCHRKGQLVIGLRASLVRPRKPPQIGAKLGTRISLIQTMIISREQHDAMMPSWLKNICRQIRSERLLSLYAAASLIEKGTFTLSIQPAMAWEGDSVLVSRPLYRWPI